MKRSIIFINSLFPCLSETFVYDQFRTLQAAGMDFHIVSNNRPKDGEVHPRMKDIQREVFYLAEASPKDMLAAHLSTFLRHPLRYLASLARLPLSGEPLKTALAQFTGAALILNRYHDLPTLHLHAHFTYGAAGVALWASRLGGIPYSLTLHGSDLIYDNPPDLGERLQNAEGIISISQFNVDFLHQHFPKVQPRYLETIRMGIVPLKAPAHRPLRSDCLHILNVGRLSDHKAQHCLIEACALLAQRGLSFRCDIVGEGDRRPLLEKRIAEHGLEGRIHLLGPKFHHEVLKLYETADLFVLCSIAEGQPIVLMEAMRAGVPVISTAISAIPELIQDSGILVPPSTPEVLANAIAEICNNRVDLAPMTDRAKQIVSTEYDLEANHRKFKAWLEALP